MYDAWEHYFLHRQGGKAKVGEAGWNEWVYADVGADGRPVLPLEKVGAVVAVSLPFMAPARKHVPNTGTHPAHSGALSSLSPSTLPLRCWRRASH